MADVKWIKIVTNIFDDDKILLIESLPEADTILIIWFKLLCLAGKQNNGGVFMLSNKKPFSIEMLATILKRDIEVVSEALDVFEEFGMIEYVNDVITIPNWGKYQTLDLIEKRRKYQRDYMQRKRQEQREKIIEDLDKPKETKNKGETKTSTSSKDKDKSNYPSISKQIIEFTNNEELGRILKEFTEMREKIRKKLTNYAFHLILHKLSRLSANTETQIEILNQSIKNSWQDIYALKTDNSSYQTYQKGKKEKQVPDWYGQYEKQLENLPKEEEKEMTQEEIDKVLKEAKETFS